jgi:hypothetical protein
MLTGPHLVKMFPAYNGTPIAISAFTEARQLPLSWARSSPCYHPTSWKIHVNVILSSTPRSTKLSHSLTLSWARSTPCYHPTSWKIHFNVILSSTPRSSKLSHSHRFTYYDTARTSALIRTFYMAQQSHPSRIYHPNNIWRGEQMIKLLTVWSTSPLLLPNMLLNTLISKTLNLCSSLTVGDKMLTHTKQATLLLCTPT